MGYFPVLNTAKKAMKGKSPIAKPQGTGTGTPKKWGGMANPAISKPMPMRMGKIVK